MATRNKQQIIKMAINGSGIRDTVRVLGVGINIVIGQLKKNRQAIKRHQYKTHTEKKRL